MFTDRQWRAVEAGIGDIHTAMLAALGLVRAAALWAPARGELGRNRDGASRGVDGRQPNPCGHAAQLLCRALAALPAAARAARIRLRADARYFAGSLARGALVAQVKFAIGAKRIARLWRILDGVAEGGWTDAIDMDGA